MINAELLDSAVLSRLDQPCRDAERALEGLEDAAVGIDAKIEETQGAITTIVTGPVASPSSEDANSRTSLSRRSTAHRWGSSRRTPRNMAEKLNSATPSNRPSSTYLHVRMSSPDL